MFTSLDSSQQELMRRHLQMVMKLNEKMNLTRIADGEEGMLLHVEDSLGALPEMKEAPEGPYADLGSGAGFPGIPLAIATGRKTLLIDARMKKMNAVQGIVESLGLESTIGVYAGRAELYARKNPNAFCVITARALAKLSVLLELSAPLLKRGGRAIFYKSHVEEGEMKDAIRVCDTTGMRLVGDRNFMLGGAYERRIVTFESVAPPKMKLPRLEGQAQKNPL
ncbi:MAG TPA: 16S rRNA (guanine(527)-N(7))-methyltransferase RsmG [Eggerthellaceae bacterium]|nr:16S rRNA (guanine(527)-N(7))-methyltransferase RsmG [Eggerthellaceae bacterium]